MFDIQEQKTFTKKADLTWIYLLAPVIFLWGCCFAAYYLRRWLIERRLHKMVQE